MYQAKAGGKGRHQVFSPVSSEAPDAAAGRRPWSDRRPTVRRSPFPTRLEPEAG
jgi:hypothetical protein